MRNFGLDDPEKERLFSAGMVEVFSEDIPVLEAQQRNLDAGRSRIDIGVDAAPLAARRMLEAMLAREKAS